MAVYIDDYNAPFGNMLMCHMVADTPEELLQMVDAIGVARKWIQYPGTPNEHFDICLAKKKLAIKRGAIEITARRYADIVKQKELQPALPGIKVSTDDKGITWGFMPMRQLKMDIPKGTKLFSETNATDHH